jgi:hypothetical protein
MAVLPLVLLILYCTSCKVRPDEGFMMRLKHGPVRRYSREYLCKRKSSSIQRMYVCVYVYICMYVSAHVRLYVCM